MKNLVAATAITLMSICGNAIAADANQLTIDEKAALSNIISQDVSVGFMGIKSHYEYGYKPVTANEMQAIYSANEVKGDRTFKGKGLIISGTVESIKSGYKDVPVVALESGDRIRNVNLEFSTKYEDIAVELVKGQRVTFACTGGAVVMGFPSLVECMPVDVAQAALTEKKAKEIVDELASGKFSDEKTPKVITSLKIFTKATNNYQSCKPDDLDCLVKAKDEYLAKPGAKEEAKSILDSYTVK